MQELAEETITMQHEQGGAEQARIQAKERLDRLPAITIASVGGHPLAETIEDERDR